MNYYHLKSSDDRVYQKVARSRFTYAFRTEVSAMAASLGWSDSKCVNYIQRKLKEKNNVTIEVTTTSNFANRLVTQ